MAVIYEINPPKIPDAKTSNDEINSLLAKLVQRV
ncbi:MAG: 5,10-methenyltetrahydrofolate synthetase, partial [Nitrosarchaeum sp.]|nr:5,10-methenyltetrahydrofolate synthetase [Nitrosarchaeum sp.]